MPESEGMRIVDLVDVGTLSKDAELIIVQDNLTQKSTVRKVAEFFKYDDVPLTDEVRSAFSDIDIINTQLVDIESKMPNWDAVFGWGNHAAVGYQMSTVSGTPLITSNGKFNDALLSDNVYTNHKYKFNWVDDDISNENITDFQQDFQYRVTLDGEYLYAFGVSPIKLRFVDGMYIMSGNKDVMHYPGNLTPDNIELMQHRSI